MRNIFDRPFGDDAKQSLNDEALSNSIRIILEMVAPQTARGPLIGFGAGAAIAELDLAKGLGIEDVTLVDRYPVNIPDFKGSYVDSEMFRYLENSRAQYGFVTLFGVEYVLAHRANWARLENGLNKITTPGSIVAISPDVKFNFNNNMYKTLFKSESYLYLAQRI